MVRLPAGEFLMGTPRAIQVPTEIPAELEPLQVRVTRPFAIGRYEVTRAEYQVFARDTGRTGKPVRCRTWVEAVQGFRDLDISWDAPNVPAKPQGNHPATCIDWHDSRAYAEWLSQRTGQRYRLPTEVEWEYAARGGTNTLNHWGNSADTGCAFANSNDRSTAERYPLSWTLVRCRDGFADIAPVGSLRPNAFGLYDMIGNAWEWAEDCAGLTYFGRPTDQRAWIWDGGCERRVQRGGGWITGPERSRAGFHGDGNADDRSDFAGFRVVRELQPVHAPAAAAPAPPSATLPVAATGPASAIATAGPFRDCATCPELIAVPAGAFSLGTSTDAYEHDVASGETPPLNVRIRRPFALGRFEVTRAEFSAFASATGHRPRWPCALDAASPPAAPARCITVDDARAYLAWLGTQSGQRYRLPSETEWEYAARAGTTGARSWSARHSHEGVSISTTCDFGNVYDVSARSLALPVPHARCTDAYPGDAPVGSFQPNPWGFHDLIGNVRERLGDCFTTSYKGRPADERTWAWADCRYRAVRGGSWLSRPWAARSAARDYVVDDATAATISDVGFRIARDLMQP